MQNICSGPWWNIFSFPTFPYESRPKSEIGVVQFDMNLLQSFGIIQPKKTKLIKQSQKAAPGLNWTEQDLR